MNSPRENFRPPRTPAGAINSAAANTTSEGLKRRYEEYMLLARARAQVGDQIEAENLYQHAEHFYRTAALLKAGHLK